MDSNVSVEKVKSWPQAVKDYYGDLRAEMRRVTWPTRQQVESTTAVVIFCVFAFAAYFAVVDQLLNRSVTQLYKVLTK